MSTKTYYLTKYALSSNGVITTFTATDGPSEYGYIKPDGPGWHSFKFGVAVHETPDSAIAAAEAARIKKISSLKKQITALEKLTFTVKETA